ncbi:MAG: flippase [Solirubrobacteraceae bacterium]
MDTVILAPPSKSSDVDPSLLVPMSTLARHTTKQRAARDIGMQIGVRIANLALGAVVTALVVRTLGESGYGQWSTGFAVIGLVGYFANFGMEGVALREAAREPEDAHEWIGSVMLLRLLVMAPVMIVSLAAIFVLHRSHAMLVAGIIMIVAMPFGGVGALGLLFQLRVDNRVPMLVLTLRSVLWGIVVLIIYLDHGGMVPLAIGLVSTNAVGSIVQAVAALKLDTPIPRPTRKHLRDVVRIGLPIGISGALIICYASVDQIIVYTLAGTKESGLYGSVYNLLNQAHFVPISVLTTLAPVIAASWPRDRARLLRTSRLTAELLAVTSFGGLAFAIAASAPAVRLIFGPSFVRGAPALPVLGAAFVFISFGYLNGQLLVVLGLQRRLLRISVIALVVNVCGNLILVPLTGFMGAAWMTLITEVVVCLASLSLILKTLEMPLPKPGRIGRAALAAALLTAALEALRLAHAPLGVLVAAACLAYPTLLFALRALAVEDVRILLGRRAIS